MKLNSPAEALAFLLGLSPSAIRMGLDRIHLALRRLKNPERAYPSLHLAGTNGKGSTSAFAASCLREGGYRVGLYTSPHLVRVNERIQVNGEEISDELFGTRILEVVELYPELCEEPYPLSYFELGTLVALHHFMREEVDVAVLETGLGGRLDATTAARTVVSAITPISFDHMDYLGHTLAAIASEKAGIFKPSVPAVSAAQAPEVLRVLEEHARGVGTSLVVEGREFSLTADPHAPGVFAYAGLRWRLPALTLGLRGPHQRQNAAVALAALERLEEQGLKLPAEAIRKGLASARWPGRLEEIDDAPTVVLDGAHNPAGVEALFAALAAEYPGRPLHLLFSVLGDKDHRPMVRTLFPRAATAHLAPLPTPRVLLPERYLEEARAHCADSRAHGSVAEALAEAKRAASASGGIVVAAGSLFLVGEVKKLY